MTMRIYTVSEFVYEVRELLSEISVTVQGEVSNFHETQSRFVFFDLKDVNSYISCFLLKFQFDRLGVPIEDGMEIRVTGSPSLFVKSGRFHFQVRAIELVGAGALQRQFEETKRRLAAEGLFDERRKRPLPRFPQIISVVTSPDAAAYTDVLRILKNRSFSLTIRLFPVRVQGREAIPDLIEAVQHCNDHDPDTDLIIMTRGGGSLEDLQAFNDEGVVRAVFGSRIPVIAGIGHERDETLVELAADQRASTPSNAAERAVADRRDVAYQMDQMLRAQYTGVIHHIQIFNREVDHALEGMEAGLRHPHEHLDRLEHALELQVQGFSNRLQRKEQEVGVEAAGLRSGMAHLLRRNGERLSAAVQLLKSLGPQAVLERGYSLTMDSAGRMVRSIRALRPGQQVQTRLHDGQFTSTVDSRS
jgi:exodeoxyribonuclease VII large subunit